MFIYHIEPIAKKNRLLWRLVKGKKGGKQVAVMRLNRGERFAESTSRDTDEVIGVVHGHGLITVGDRAIRADEHETVYVPAGTEHAVVNTGHAPLELYLVYTPVDTVTRTYPRKPAKKGALYASLH